ncbi:MAG: histidine kinase dimerization/phospho-acceptor domain-containing protein [Roseobacter sp.]
MDFTAPEKARDASLLLPDTPYASNAFEDLVYLISHDVRNPMRAVIELLQWIAEGLAQAGVKLKGSVAESIELMNMHTGRLDRMLVDLLTFSRIGRMQDLTETEVDVTLSEGVMAAAHRLKCICPKKAP